MKSTIGYLGWCAVITSFACASPQQRPVTTSAADQAQYASRYPDALASARQRFSDQETQARSKMAEIKGYPDAVDAKAAPYMLEVYRLADSAGKSQVYADRYEETATVRDFFEEEKATLHQAVQGSAHYAAKQNECKNPADVGGAAVFGLNKAVDKQLEDRLRDRDEAHAYIDSHATAMGTKGADTLREQADKISELSYLVHVGVERTRARVGQMLEEGSQVKSTLENAAEAAKAQAADSKQPEGDRKVAETRAQAASAALGRVDAEQQQAKSLFDQTEQRIKVLRDEYEQAMNALSEAAEKKAGQAP